VLVSGVNRHPEGRRGYTAAVRVRRDRSAGYAGPFRISL